jgi:hypothetical protein
VAIFGLKFHPQHSGYLLSRGNFGSKFHTPHSGYLLPRGHFCIEIPQATLRLFIATWSYLDRNFHSLHSGYLLPHGHIWIEISHATFRLFTVMWSYLDRTFPRHPQAIYCHVVIFGSKFHSPHLFPLYFESNILHMQGTYNTIHNLTRVLAGAANNVPHISVRTSISCLNMWPCRRVPGCCTWRCCLTSTSYSLASTFRSIVSSW